MVQAAAEGCYVSGLFLEAARWNSTAGCLAAAKPGEMFSRLPVLHLKPCAHYTPPATGYRCPLYRTVQRAGALSTTGSSTNFVGHLSLPIAQGTTPVEWTLQGTAALCAVPE